MARIKCGNQRRERNFNWRLCEGEKENLEHILNCREFKKLVKAELSLALKEVIRDGGNDPIFCTTILKGPIEPELRKYCKIFEREATVKEVAEL